VPVRAELLATAGDLGARLGAGLRRLVERRKTELRSAARALPQPEALLAQPRQRLDLAGQRLPTALKTGLDRRRVALAKAAARLESRSPRAQLAMRRERLDQYGQRLLRGLRNALDRKADKLAGAGRLLEGYSYQGVLKRGFALVIDADGAPVRSVEQAQSGAVVKVTVSDGDFEATVGRGAGAPTRRPSKPGPRSSEPDLFS
jgi:exodeoxyribonuclease VII large subunit